jgi:preprotein translocase subunit Sec61beta
MYLFICKGESAMKLHPKRILAMTLAVLILLSCAA